MALIDVTPKMTNYTVPAPYVVSYSGTVYFPSGIQAWRAFDDNDTTYFTPNTSFAGIGGLKIDLNKPTKMNTIGALIEVNNAYASVKAKVSIYGSNDDKAYTFIGTYTILKHNVFNTYDMSDNHSYRYYSFNITVGSVYSQYIKVRTIKLYYNDTLFATPSENIKGVVYSELKKVVDKYSAAFETEE